MSNPPNLFDIGTKELHQDAFLAWLIAWADPSYQQHDAPLHECGVAFINYLICKQHTCMKGSVVSVKCDRQREKIDIWAEVRTTEVNYLVIIEDKVYAGEHGEQLKRYAAAALRFCVEEGFKTVYIYLKSTSESEKNFRKVREQGFATVTRHDILKFFTAFSNVTNSIFSDFLKWLQKRDEEHSVFKSLSPAQWGGKGWQGFYEAVEASMSVVGWHYVNPPAGDGFWNLCLNWLYWDGFPVYIQIAQGPLCFKIATNEDEIEYEGKFDKAHKRNEWHEIIMSAANEKGLHEIRKPARFGHGAYMTVAYVPIEIWLGDEGKAPDIQEVIGRLKTYMDFLSGCLSK